MSVIRNSLWIVAALGFLFLAAFPFIARPQVEWPVNTAARNYGLTTEVCVTNAAGGTLVPATALGNRKAIEVQNLGPNEIYCTVANPPGVAPLVGTLGRLVDKKANAPGNVWSLDVGPNVVLKCIAATAAQAEGTGCTMVTEVR